MTADETTDPKPKRSVWRIRRGPLLLSVAFAILTAGMIFSLVISDLASSRARSESAHARVLTEELRKATAQLKADEIQLKADETRFQTEQARLDERSCQRANRLADGLLSISDVRSPFRKSPTLILKSPGATDLQRTTAKTTLAGIDALQRVFGSLFKIERCVAPTP